jgi:hypothetical protein
MPWCPKCKEEFQEGYTICSDCKVELVDELPEVEEYIPFFQSETKKIAEKLAKFFSYSELKSVIRYNEELEAYIVYVPSHKRKDAQKLYQAFYFVERERHENGLDEEEDDNGEERPKASEELSDEEAKVEAEEAELSSEEAKASEDTHIQENFIEGKALYRDSWNEKDTAEDMEEEEEEAEKIAPSTYVMKAERYKDYTSTVSVFLGLGILGLIFVILNIVGVLSVLNGILPLSVMGVLFLFFIIVGISTQKKARELRLEIDDEKKMTDQINEWLKENVTAEYLGSLGDDSISAELNYIRVTETIKERLEEIFPGQNSDFLDRLIEEFYSANFDTEDLSV